MHDPDTNELLNGSLAADGDDDAANGLVRKASRLAVAASLAALLLALAAALLAEKPTEVSTQDCASIEGADARLRCYDQSASPAASQPARGAVAPKLN